MQAQKLTDILLELRSASILVRNNPTEDCLRETMRKYDMLFLGKDFNCINSAELAHSIRTFFNIQIDNEELNKLIPTVCKALNMKYDPMIDVADATKTNPPIACYQITL